MSNFPIPNTLLRHTDNPQTMLQHIPNSFSLQIHPEPAQLPDCLTCSFTHTPVTPLTRARPRCTWHGQSTHLFTYTPECESHIPHPPGLQIMHL